jgi:hypothetical protein
MIFDLNKKFISEEKTEIRNSPEGMDSQKFEIRCSLCRRISNIEYRILNDEFSVVPTIGVGLL